MAEIDSLIVKLDDNVADAEKLKLEDGDVLVVTSPQRLGAETYHHLADHLHSLVSNLGVNAQVLLLDGGMQAGLLKTSRLPKVEEPFTDVQRSVCDGTFGVKSQG